jgi:hypothetical protein
MTYSRCILTTSSVMLIHSQGFLQIAQTDSEPSRKKLVAKGMCGEFRILPNSKHYISESRNVKESTNNTVSPSVLLFSCVCELLPPSGLGLRLSSFF